MYGIRAALTRPKETGGTAGTPALSLLAHNRPDLAQGFDPRRVADHFRQRGSAECGFDFGERVVQPPMQRAQLGPVRLQIERARFDPPNRIGRIDDIKNRQFLGARAKLTPPLAPRWLFTIPARTSICSTFTK